MGLFSFVKSAGRKIGLFGGQQAAEAEQAAAEGDFSRDPVVLAAQEAFDAEIVPDSVRRID